MSIKRKFNSLLYSFSGWKDISFLGGGHVISAILTMLYGKLLTLYISPEDLGTFNLEMTSMLLFYSIIITPIIQSYMKELQVFNNEKVIKYYGLFLLKIYLVFLILVVIYCYFIENNFYSILIFVSGVSQSVFLFFNSYLNLSFKYKKVAFIQVINPLINLLLLTILVYNFQSKPSLLWTNYIILYCFLSIIVIYFLPDSRVVKHIAKHNLSKLDTEVFFANLQKYVKPLFFYTIFGWLVNYADRYIIDYYLTKSDVGYYVTGYGLGAKMAIVAGPFNQYLMPIIYKYRKDNVMDKEINNATYKCIFFFFTISAPLWVISVLFYNEIGSIFLSKIYYNSFAIIPIVALAYIFSNICQFMEIKFYSYGNTKYIYYGMISNFLINLPINILFTPKLGMLGAAYATLAGYFIQSCVVFYLFSFKNVPLLQVKEYR